MTMPNDTVWRVRSTGSNTNGGGYSASQTGTLSTTLNGSLSSGATTVVVASATGWPSSGNYYARIGAVGQEQFSSGATGSSEIVLVTAGQGTTSWTVTRGQLGTTAQAFATGIVVDNNLAQCDTAPTTWAKSDGTSTASTTFVSATATFDPTVVGNVLWLASGTGTTVGAYCVTGFTNSTTITLDRASGTYTAGVFKIGGAWIDPTTNTCTSTWIKPGNVIYIRAGGSANWSGGSGTVDYTGVGLNFLPNGDSTNGYIKYIGENGKPYIKSASGSILTLYDSTAYVWMQNLFGISGGTGDAGQGVFGVGSPGVMNNITIDQNGHDVTGLSVGPAGAFGCEVFSGVANSGAAGSRYGIIALYGNTPNIDGCNIHDCWGGGINVSTGFVATNTTIAKNRGDGIVLSSGFSATFYGANLTGCTIDANHGNGINLGDNGALAAFNMRGCLITNHTTASTYGIKCSGAGSQAQNDLLRGYIDYNSYFGNTTNTLNLTVGTGRVNGTQLHDNIGTDPQYVAQSTENYAIGTNLKGLGYPGSTLPFLQSLSGQTTGVTGYNDPGGVQRQEVGGTTVVNINRTIMLTEDTDYV